MATTSTAFDSTLQNLGITRAKPAAGTTATGASTATGKTKTTLDQSDFLTLLTTQLKNQDPFEPMDNTQMVAQMAQFSSVAGISEMNKTLSGVATKLGSTSASDAMSYVGKTVLTEGSTAYPRSTGGLDGAVELDSDASQVTISIADAQGGTLRSMQIGKHAKGTATFEWDGKDGSGNDVGAGPFTITAFATNGDKTVTSRTLVWAPVESVSLPSSGAPKLKVVGVGDVDPSDVRSAT
ncbi:flagellar hook assembly protein FlgD [Sphingomonadaceae bacterium OTU29MARTA1]|nr:flagellar hook assembly protein FlgD [Sphingomonadaceae bacterium OTU29LAMAA1]USU10223.1 flagellar hook assembly protein FlgD [Sphingomonadaceae bacterium OTU29MARTA1]USU13670.1 flagellar hook assembly protein FlgD [Sphingomonadaceae bacterium OTU29THOMA1]